MAPLHTYPAVQNQWSRPFFGTSLQIHKILCVTKIIAISLSADVPILRYF